MSEFKHHDKNTTLNSICIVDCTANKKPNKPKSWT